MGAQLRIGERQVGQVVVLDLAGRLEIADGDIELRACIDRLFTEGRIRLLINLREVEHIDSGGISLLIAKYFGARKRGGDLKLLHLTARTHRALAVTRLLTIFETFDDEAAALASFN